MTDDDLKRREGLCERCGTEYAGWFAPNPLWNATVRPEGTDEWNFLCPTCFGNLAAERGTYTGTWCMTSDITGHEQAAHLAYVLSEIIIQATAAHDEYRNGPA